MMKIKQPAMKSRKEKEFNIVQKALGGDQRAYSEIYNKYHLSLLYQVKKIVKDEEVATDITIETFEKAFEALHRYRPEYALSTWLFRIGINCAIDYTRKQQQFYFVPLDNLSTSKDDEPMEYQLKCPDKNPDELLMDKQRTDYIKGLVQCLPRFQRRLVELRYLDHFTYGEIADQMQVPLGTVKGMMHRAKEMLYERVTYKEPEEEPINN